MVWFLWTVCVLSCVLFHIGNAKELHHVIVVKVGEI